MTVVLAVLLVIALVVIAWLLIQGGNEKPPDNPQSEQTEPVEKLTDSIDIPGFGELHFKAGQTEQHISRDRNPCRPARDRPWGDRMAADTGRE